MCFNFMTVYPIAAIKNLENRPLRLCTDVIDFAKGVQGGAGSLVGMAARCVAAPPKTLPAQRGEAGWGRRPSPIAAPPAAGAARRRVIRF
jgi:hypothetical protein